MRVSVVIPALNEAAGIAATVQSATAQAGPVEVLVADGGSADETRTIAERAGARVIEAPRGRARQMNAGAAVATGEALVFLHADTTLPPDALRLVRHALGGPDVMGGCFRTTFDEATSPMMRLWQARLWMRWHRLAFGDRAPFVRASAFRAAGGFRDQPLFEDLELVQAIRRQGRFVFLDADVVTSGRRFRANGAFRQQARNLALWAGWNVGVSPERLKRFYPDGKGRG